MTRSADEAIDEAQAKAEAADAKRRAEQGKLSPEKRRQEAKEHGFGFSDGEGVDDEVGALLPSVAGAKLAADIAANTSEELRIVRREAEIAPKRAALTRAKTDAALTQAELDMQRRTLAKEIKQLKAAEHVEVAMALIKMGADVDAADDDGQTALHYAATCERAEMCRLLLESGADPDAEDADGDTPNALGAVGLAMRSPGAD